MSTKKESVIVMKDGVECNDHACCNDCCARPDIYPIIDEIAIRTSDYLEIVVEFGDYPIEESDVLGLVMRMYLKGAYWEAIDYLTDLFIMAECPEASEQLTLLEASNDGRIGMMFIESFFEANGFISIHTGDPSDIHHIC